MLLVINEKACIGLLNNDQPVQVCQPVKKLEQFLKSLVSLMEVCSRLRDSQRLYLVFLHSGATQQKVNSLAKAGLIKFFRDKKTFIFYIGLLYDE